MGKFLLSTLLLLTTAFASTAETYSLVTSLDELGDDASYIIVDTEGKLAMGAQNTNNRAAVAVNIENGIVEAGDNVAVLSIKPVSGGYSFYVTNLNQGYLYDANTGNGKNNYLKTQEEETYATVSIDGTNGNATIKFQKGGTTRNILRRNSSNNIFSCYSSGQADVQIYKLNNVITYPTECSAPVFKINGVEITETEITAYAGTTISVSSATSKAETRWTVNETSISGNEYTIPTDANVGTVYSFRAQSHVQGESTMIESTVTDLTITIAALPLEGYFYSPSVTTAPVYATKLMNKSGVEGGSNNTKTAALCAVEGGFNSNFANLTFSDKDGNNFAYINSSKNISIYKENTFTISVAEGYYITSIAMDKTKDGLTADGGEFTEGNWANKEGETKSSVKFTYNASSNWTSGCISIIIVKYALLPVVEPEALSKPEIHEDCQSMLTEGAITKEGNLKFADVAEGIDLWYKLEQNQSANALAEVDATHEHGTEGYTKYDPATGIDITKNHVGHTLTVFACDASNDIHSEPVSYAVTVPTGVEEIEAEGAGDVRWFDMQGREIKGQPEKGIYVRVANGKASKVVL